MEKNLQLFENRSFVYRNKTYIVLSCEIKSQKAVIMTDKRTWVLHSSELDQLISEIAFIETEDNDIEQQKSNKGLQVSPQKVLVAEIVKQNDLAGRLTEKLEDVFHLVERDFNEANLKKSKAMVEIANSIANVQMTAYKFLSLNK